MAFDNTAVLRAAGCLEHRFFVGPFSECVGAIRDGQLPAAGAVTEGLGPRVAGGWQVSGSGV